jgi:lipopolysaccharide export system protein LptC
MSVTANPGLEALQPPHHGSWEPRRALALDVARRRTVFVRRLRMGFMAAAAAIVALLLIQLILGNRGTVESETEAVSSDSRMVNPRFVGRDDALIPYVVTADAAIRHRDGAPDVTDLERPRLDYDFLNTDASRVLAETGRYDANNRVLDLYSDVNLNTDDGYSFASEHARIFLREARVVGEEPVAGSGPMGMIRADRYEIREGGDLLIFDGNVRMTLIQDRTDMSRARQEEGSE